MAETAIRLSGITKLFGPRAANVASQMADPAARPALIERHREELALVDVSLSVLRGTIQVVMGLSGSGKSTLVRHINRLIEPTAGTVEVEGENVLALSPRALDAFRREHVSMVFQRFALLPHRTVLENVAYGLKMANVPRGPRDERARHWIERVGLAGTQDRHPDQLSGGMQQRVGLARALATEAPIMLMDEAFSALDPLIRTDMQSLLLDLQKDLNRTIVFITHDLDEALRLGDRIAILKSGELVREGTGQEIILDPGSDYVAAFVGDVDHGRWLEIGSLGFQPLAGGEADASLPRLSHRSNLRHAARALTEADADTGIMVDEAGRPIGTIRLQDVVAALVRPTRLERTTDVRRKGAALRVSAPG